MSLPVPHAHDLPDTAVVAVPVPGHGLAVYRLLHGGDPRVEDFEPDYTRPQAQLRGIPELFRASISTWLERDQALSASTLRRAHIARVELTPGPLTRVALTEHDPFGEHRPGHVDVWGYPRELFACVVEVSVVER